MAEHLITLSYKETSLSLSQALLMLENQEDMDNFLKDLCTPQEMKALQERWRCAQLLASGELSYREIQQQIGASLTTISRVARFLKDEPYKGYKHLIDLINTRRKRA